MYCIQHGFRFHCVGGCWDRTQDKLPYLGDEAQFEFCQTYDVITVCQRPAGDVHQVSLGDQDHQVGLEIRISR
jgi:hypothetical protein